jgi:hypothetical protein
MEYKKILSNQDCMIIDTKEKGRCIIANRDFSWKEIVTINPILFVEREASHVSILKHYCFYPLFGYGLDPKMVIVMLGIGFLFSHSSNFNLKIIWDFKNSLVYFKAVRDIKKGEELTIDYATKLWFTEKPSLQIDLEGENNED